MYQVLGEVPIFGIQLELVVGIIIILPVMNFDLIHNIRIIFQNEIFNLPVLVRHQGLVEWSHFNAIVVNDVSPLFVTTVKDSTALAFCIVVFPVTVLVLEPFATPLLGQTRLTSEPIISGQPI